MTAPGILTPYNNRKTLKVEDFKLPGLGDEIYWGAKGINGGIPIGFQGENGGTNIRNQNWN